MSKVPRISDVSDRNGHDKPQNGNEHAEIVEILKATRLSKGEIEDEEPKRPRKSDVIDATSRDFEAYEVGSSILEGAKQEIEDEEKSEKMVSKDALSNNLNFSPRIYDLTVETRFMRPRKRNGG